MDVAEKYGRAQSWGRIPTEAIIRADVTNYLIRSGSKILGSYQWQHRDTSDLLALLLEHGYYWSDPSRLIVRSERRDPPDWDGYVAALLDFAISKVVRESELQQRLATVLAQVAEQKYQAAIADLGDT